MKIIKVFTYKRHFDYDGKELKAKFISSHDEDLETTDYKKELPGLAKKYNCDFVEVAVININPKIEKL